MSIMQQSVKLQKRELCIAHHVANASEIQEQLLVRVET